MEYIKGTTSFQITYDTVISLGKFDGIHRGHELLLEQMMKKRDAGLKTVIFTFDVPPKPGQEAGKVLTTNREKEEICRILGIDYLIECPFVDEIRHMEAEDFIRMIVESLHLKCVVVGTDFRFGHERKGDYHMLVDFAKIYGYEVIVVDKMQDQGRDISSTYIREEIQKGNIEKANSLLGYDFFIQGIVQHGRHMGQAVLGVPTVNLIPPEEKLLPPFGVYVCEIEALGKTWHGIADIGRKPTVEGNNPVAVEANIFDFTGNLYGEQIKVSLKKWTRGEMKFDTLEDLKCQIQSDIAFARHYFSR
ncbi:MAG: bifunctional riboflavin kinase/FAD synthetase [Lachnospiraceae bacterium]|nr:bifunctional riboflavin kinase/FAD synthetase [Lachnospiraceae bacterium]